MFDFLVKLFITPENVVGVILKLTDIIGMCLIFTIFNIKWYKALIPFYDKYLIYNEVFKHKWICFIFNIIFTGIHTRCLILFKKHLFQNLITFIKMKDISTINIDLWYLIILIVIEIVSFIILFIFERICNYRIVKRLNINIFFQIGTFLCPNIFLFIDAIWYKSHNLNKEI